MYSYSRAENLRPAATHKHCNRKASSSSPANTCGRPILNSLSAWSMRAGNRVQGTGYSGKSKNKCTQPRVNANERELDEVKTGPSPRLNFKLPGSKITKNSTVQTVLSTVCTPKAHSLLCGQFFHSPLRGCKPSPDNTPTYPITNVSSHHQQPKTFTSGRLVRQ